MDARNGRVLLDKLHLLGFPIPLTHSSPGSSSASSIFMFRIKQESVDFKTVQAIDNGGCNASYCFILEVVESDHA